MTIPYSGEPDRACSSDRVLYDWWGTKGPTIKNDQYEHKDSATLTALLSPLSLLRNYLYGNIL